MIPQTLYVDPYPDGYPSHLLNGICGEGTPCERPGPDVAIYLDGR